MHLIERNGKYYEDEIMDIYCRYACISTYRSLITCLYIGLQVQYQHVLLAVRVKSAVTVKSCTTHLPAHRAVGPVHP